MESSAEFLLGLLERDDPAFVVQEDLDGPPIHGNTRLEVIWTAIPAILLVGLCTYAFIVLENVEKAQANTMEVRVVGEQFAWTFYYEKDGKEVASRDLHLEVDRPVRFILQSKDVLHDFWVPAFRMKKDAVPGLDVTYRVTPNRVDEYPIVCAELCGLGHSVMRSTVFVQEKADYDKWFSELGAPAATPEAGGGGGGGADGKAIFTSEQGNCFSCHAQGKKEGGLSLDTYPKLMEGGSSGQVAIAGDLDSSRLWALVSHTEKPEMPPKQDKLAAAKLDVLKKWIEGGVLENSGSKANIKKKPSLELAAPATSGKPAAFFAETIQGVGGYIVPPPGYFQRMAEIIRRYGGLFICDEVQTGFGRTGGTWFGIEHWEVEPDIMVMAKGIASGFPVGATITTDEIAAAWTAKTISTFGANPISMTAEASSPWNS